MGYRDYNTTLKTLNHYQNKNGTSVPFFTVDKPHGLYGVNSNDISYYLHPYQIVQNSDKNYERVFSSWFVNQEHNSQDYSNHGHAFFLLDKQENLKCITEPYPSQSDYIKNECLVCSNLTRYRIKSGWIRYDYENLLNEDLPTRSYDTTYDYSHSYRIKNNTNFLPAVRVKKSGSRKYIICEQYKLKSLLMSINEDKYNFLNTKMIIVGQKNGSIILTNNGFNFDAIQLDTQSIVFDKNTSLENQRYHTKVRSQFYDKVGYIQGIGYSLYDNYKNNSGFIENWVFREKNDVEQGGYYYTPVLDLNEDDTFNNYNIEEVQYYDENGYLVGYKLTGYLIDVKTLKISEEIICKPVDN